MELVGLKFNRWTITALAGKTGPQKKMMVEVLCDCGTRATKRYDHLKSGGSRSCGCLQKEEFSARRLKHGLTKTPIYQVWGDMKKRCTNPNYKEWAFYGGRGIKICDRWLDFQNFYDDMGDLPFKYARLDRIDNNGNYEPENCRWITISENNRNKRSNINITFNGDTKCLFDWAYQLGIEPRTLWARLNTYKWDIGKAFTTPVHSNKSTGSAQVML